MLQKGPPSLQGRALPVGNSPLLASLPSLSLLLSALQSLQHTRAGDVLPLGCPVLHGLKVLVQSREAKNTALNGAATAASLHLSFPCCAAAGGFRVPVTVPGSKSLLGKDPAVLAVSCCSLSVCGRIAVLYGSWDVGEAKAQLWERQWGGIRFAALDVKAASHQNGCRAILGAFGNGVGSQRPAGLFGDDSCPDVSASWHIKHTLCCPALTHLQITASASPHPQRHSLGMEGNPGGFWGLRGVPTSS